MSQTQSNLASPSFQTSLTFIEKVESNRNSNSVSKIFQKKYGRNYESNEEVQSQYLIGNASLLQSSPSSIEVIRIDEAKQENQNDGNSEVKQEEKVQIINDSNTFNKKQQSFFKEQICQNDHHLLSSSKNDNNNSQLKTQFFMSQNLVSYSDEIRVEGNQGNFINQNNYCVFNSQILNNQSHLRNISSTDEDSNMNVNLCQNQSHLFKSYKYQTRMSFNQFQESFIQDKHFQFLSITVENDYWVDLINFYEQQSNQNQ